MRHSAFVLCDRYCFWSSSAKSASARFLLKLLKCHIVISFCCFAQIDLLRLSSLLHIPKTNARTKFIAVNLFVDLIATPCIYESMSNPVIRLQNHIAKHGLTQKQIAKKARISEGALSNFLAEKTVMLYPLAVKVEKVTGLKSFAVQVLNMQIKGK
jgi:hypothetical protein